MPAFSEPYKRRLLQAVDAFFDLEDEEQAAFLIQLEKEQGVAFRNRLEQLIAAAENVALLNNPGLPWLTEPDFAGTVLGERYRIVRQLGRGSFGTVWLGEHIELAPKSVAIKIPHPTLLNDISEDSIRAEIQSLVQLSHPMIASIIDRGKTPDQTPYFVMQYIPGESLRDLIDRKAWEPRRVCRLIASLADALEYAHQLGIAHFDIKPENILIRNAGKTFELPFLVDFGISGIQRLLNARAEESPWVGSPPYAAPEYRRGDYQAQGDVYSLATVALELLLGGFPVYDPNTTALSTLIPNNLNPAMREVLRQALHPLPEMRPAGPLAFTQSLMADIAGSENFFVRDSLPLALVSLEVPNNMGQTNHNTHSLGGDIGQMTQIRQEFATLLEKNARFMESNDEENQHSSGRLYLVNEINALCNLSAALEAGRFKIAVVGDMNRGKSTLLNVLLGSDFLPVAVTRCTAVLTVVKYGEKERVTIHHTPESKHPPKEISTAEFKKQFTLKSEIQRDLEVQGKHAFPDVEFAVIETPNPLLEKGLEIIDTPGLNDTPELNQLTLEFAKDCNAILFVLNPQTMVTMQERQYFESHFKGRGLPVFFIVTRWDQIRHQLMDPDDPEAVKAAEQEIRRQLHDSVAPLLQASDGGQIAERVHELSALQAWKRLAQSPEASLEGTGFDVFYIALTDFLKEGRIRAEMRSARILTSNTYREFHRKVTDRIGILGTTRNEFETNYEAVKPIFDELRGIRDRVKFDFEQAERAETREIAASLSTFLRGLETDIRTEFAAYIPDLSYWETLKLFAPSEQQKFAAQLKDSFGQFLQYKLPEWERSAERMLEQSIGRLQTVTEGYAIDYAVNLSAISQQLTGGTVMDITDITADDSPWWTRAVAGGAAFILGDPLSAGLAAHKLFNWRDVAKNVAVVLSTQVLLYLVTGGVLGPVGVVIAALVAGIWNAQGAVERLKERVSEALAKDLPNLAVQAEDEAVRHIREIYRSAKERVLTAIEDDLASRQAEIDNLRDSMDKHEINTEQERNRLLEQDAGMLAMMRDMELAEDRWLKAL